MCENEKKNIWKMQEMFALLTAGILSFGIAWSNMFVATAPGLKQIH